MKRLIFAFLLVAGILAANKSNAQVYVRAGVNFGIPAPRVFCPPHVVYSAPYSAPYYGPYYGDRVVIARPAYPYGRYYWHERRWRHCDRW